MRPKQFSCKQVSKFFKDLDDYLKTNSVSFFKKLFRRSTNKAIQNNPEKAIIDWLISYAQKEIVVWFVDNYDLANQMTISSCISDFNDHPKEIPFADYLTMLYKKIASKSDHKKVTWLTVMTGRTITYRCDPLNTSITQKESLLNAFATGQIQAYLKAINLITTYEKNQKKIDKTAFSIFKLTRGNPLMVYLCANLIATAIRKEIKSLSIDQLWEKEISNFRDNVNTGFHYFVSNRLVQRMENNQRIVNRLWRLAIPYQLIPCKNIKHFNEFQQILFPQSQPVNDSVNPFDQLCYAGILQWDGNINHAHQFHGITHYSLSNYALTYVDEDELIDLHQNLEKFYTNLDIKEAAHYHRLCGQDRHIFKDCGITPETYWELTTASVVLDDHHKARYCFEKLPNKSELQRRIKALIKDRDKLGMDRLCGDATYFLCQKRKKGEFSGHHLDKHTLQQFIDEAPHISDFFFLMAIDETDITKKYELLRTITKEKNPTHAHAWWELGLLDLRNNQRKAAKQSFENAIQYGIKGFYDCFAKAYLMWMEANHHEANLFFRQAYDINPTFPGLREDFITLLIFLEVYQEVQKIYQQVNDISAREQFLLLETQYRQSNISDFKNMMETVSIDKFDSWEQEKMNQYLCSDCEAENDHSIEAESSMIMKHIDDEMDNSVSEYDENEDRKHELLSRKIIEREPNSCIGWSFLATALSKQGKYEEAEVAQRKAIEFKPAWSHLGAILHGQGKYEEAKAAQRKDDYYAWSKLGETLHYQGKYEESEATQRKAIVFKPDDYIAWHNLAATCQKNGAAELAQGYLQIESALLHTSTNRGNEDDWFLVASAVWADHQHWEKAEKCLQNVFEQNPEHVDALTLAAEVAFELDKIEETKNYLDQLDTIAPGHIPAYFARTQLLKRQGKTEEARKMLREYYDTLDFNDDTDQMRLRELFEDLNDADYAIQCCIQAGINSSSSDMEPDYHHARILWELKQDLFQCQEYLERLSHSKKDFSPQLYILQAELALHTGDFMACRNLLAQAKEHPDYIYLWEKERNKWKAIYDSCL
jgi:Tfp pilus assembly protein PilF